VDRIVLDDLLTPVDESYLSVLCILRAGVARGFSAVNKSSCQPPTKLATGSKAETAAPSLGLRKPPPAVSLERLPSPQMETANSRYIESGPRRGESSAATGFFALAHPRCVHPE
jgi:hypothetical protein